MSISEKITWDHDKVRQDQFILFLYIDKNKVIILPIKYWITFSPHWNKCLLLLFQEQIYYYSSLPTLQMQLSRYPRTKFPYSLTASNPQWTPTSLDFHSIHPHKKPNPMIDSFWHSLRHPLAPHGVCFLSLQLINLACQLQVYSCVFGWWQTLRTRFILVFHLSLKVTAFLDSEKSWLCCTMYIHSYLLNSRMYTK